MRWVLAIPKFKEEEKGSALEIGINKNGEIKKLITTDIFGKSSTIIFSGLTINATVKDSAFIPIIPEGVEYIEN